MSASWNSYMWILRVSRGVNVPVGCATARPTVAEYSAQLNKRWIYSRRSPEIRRVLEPLAHRHRLMVRAIVRLERIRRHHRRPQDRRPLPARDCSPRSRRDDSPRYVRDLSEIIVRIYAVISAYLRLGVIERLSLVKRVSPPSSTSLRYMKKVYSRGPHAECLKVARAWFQHDGSG